MQQIVDKLFALLKFITVVLPALMVALVLGKVVRRYIFNSCIAASEKLANWFLVCLVFLAAVVGQRGRAAGCFALTSSDLDSLHAEVRHA